MACLGDVRPWNDPCVFLVRVSVPEGMEADRMVVGPLRHGVPSLFAVSGTTGDGDPAYALGFEWSQRYAPLIGNADERKQQNELRHLERLRADFRFGGLADPFAEIRRPQSDPPDFVGRS